MLYRNENVTQTQRKEINANEIDSLRFAL